jgi:8-oxo-dGTP pyrophosphatase MutT (NUDIX family)
MDGAHVVFHRKLKMRGGRSALAVLLTKRTLDAPSDPGDWGLVGGTMDAGEKPKKAVLREIKEEISYRSRRVRVCFLCKTKRRTHTVFFYRAYLPEDMDSLRLKRNMQEKKVEGVGMAWFTRAEVRSLPVRPQDRVAVNKYFAAFS